MFWKFTFSNVKFIYLERGSSKLKVYKLNLTEGNLTKKKKEIYNNSEKISLKKKNSNIHKVLHTKKSLSTCGKLLKAIIKFSCQNYSQLNITFSISF